MNRCLTADCKKNEKPNGLSVGKAVLVVGREWCASEPTQLILNFSKQSETWEEIRRPEKSVQESTTAREGTSHPGS